MSHVHFTDPLLSLLPPVGSEGPGVVVVGGNPLGTEGQIHGSRSENRRKVNVCPFQEAPVQAGRSELSTSLFLFTPGNPSPSTYLPHCWIKHFSSFERGAATSYWGGGGTWGLFNGGPILAHRSGIHEWELVRAGLQVRCLLMGDWPH